MIKICNSCRNQFRSKFSKRKFCSRLCYSESLKGKKFIEDNSGSKNGNWKGGRRIDKDGYIVVHVPNHPFCDVHGYIREHRLKMEQKIGRYLLKTEVVHHLNGNKGDNRISNLELLTKVEHDRINALERRRHGFFIENFNPRVKKKRFLKAVEVK